MNAETSISEYLKNAKEEYIKEVETLTALLGHLSRFSNHSKLTKKIDCETLPHGLRFYVCSKETRYETSGRDVKVGGWLNGRYQEIFFGYQIPIEGWYHRLVEKIGGAINKRNLSIDSIQCTIDALPVLQSAEERLRIVFEKERLETPGNLYRTNELTAEFPLLLG